MTEISESLGLLGFEPDLIQEILRLGRKRKVAANKVLIETDSQFDEIPFVLNGLLRVMRVNDNGREIFLYYLEGGETCAMSITCCLEGKKSEIKVVADEDSELWMIPMTYLDRWVQKYPSFRKFVFANYQNRFEEMLQTVDSIAFLKMDERLMKYLLDQKQATGTYIIQKTHEQIAHELNTSRVVVSRLLKQLERQGKIEQSRNRVEIL